MQETALVGAAAREYVDRAEAAPGEEVQLLWQRSKALKVLARECDSWSRLGLGLGAWIVAVVGGVAAAAVAWDGWPLALRMLGLVVGLALVVLAGLLGRVVWRAGRRVVNAYVWWTLLPERLQSGGAGVEDWRAAPLRDAVEARVFVFQGWRPLRIGLSAVAVFTPILWADQLDQGGAAFYTGQSGSLWIFSLVLTAASLCAGIVLMGGQFRTNLAHSRRDPVQRRLLGR